MPDENGKPCIGDWYNYFCPEQGERLRADLEQALEWMGYYRTHPRPQRFEDGTPKPDLRIVPKQDETED